MNRSSRGEHDGTGPSDASSRGWDANAEAWTATVRRGLIESRRLATDRAVREAVLALDPARVLDVGCGEGWLCRSLAAAGVSAHGVDGSSGLIRAARSADPSGRYVELRYQEFARLGAAVGSGFDAAVFNFSLFDEDLGPILRSVLQVVRPGGAIIIQTLHPGAGGELSGCEDGWRLETFACSEQPFPEPIPWYFRTRDSWLQLVREVGLHVDRTAEPEHPESGAPLSLLIVGRRPAAPR